MLIHHINGLNGQTSELNLKAKAYAVAAVLLCHGIGFYGLLQVHTPQALHKNKAPIMVRFINPASPPPSVQPAPTVAPKQVPALTKPEQVQKAKPVEQKPVKQKLVKQKTIPKDTKVVYEKKVIATKQTDSTHVEPEYTQTESKTATQATSTHVDTSVKQKEMSDQVQTDQSTAHSKASTAEKAQQSSASTAQTQQVTMKSIDFGSVGVQWRKAPRLAIDSSDLRGQMREIELMIEANEQGEIKKVSVVEGSGIASLDAKVMRAVRSAKLKPYIEDGIAYPVKAKLPFQFT